MTVITLCMLSTLCPPRGGHAIGPDRGGQALPETPAATANRMAAEVGWAGPEWLCLYEIGRRESGWTVVKWNHAGSGAYGVGQALPASKMARYGADYMTSATTQVRWMLAYIRARFGSPCRALAYHNHNGSY